MHVLSKCGLNKWTPVVYGKQSQMYSFVIFSPAMIKVNEGFYGFCLRMKQEVLHKCILSLSSDTLLKVGSLIR